MKNTVFASVMIALSLAAVGPLSVSAVAGAEQAQRQSFDIPAGPLARQLTELAAQTGLLLAADAELTRDRTDRTRRADDEERL